MSYQLSVLLIILTTNIAGIVRLVIFSSFTVRKALLFVNILNILIAILLFLEKKYNWFNAEGTFIMLLIPIALIFASAELFKKKERE